METGYANDALPTASSSGGGCPANPLEGHIRYEKVRDIGKGSQGFVLLANDKFAGERVAIKCVPKGFAGCDNMKRELLNHRGLWHAHIVQFYEVFVTDQHVCIVMEYAPGGSLSDYLSNNVLPEDIARFYFQQLIFAIRYCHHMGVANRDIKLENTLLDSEKKLLKLCDFGLSKEDKSKCRTQVGTPNYLAPEIINLQKGDTYDGKGSDVWCCGVMLYAMLFRCFPFERPEERNLPKKDAILKLMERIVNGDWKVPSGATVSEGCIDLLKGILQPNPAKRMTIEDIIRHPWYATGLPDGADSINYPRRPEDGLQTVSSILEILQGAINCQEDTMDTDAVGTQ